MKKLRVTVDGKIFDVTVELLDDGGQVSPAPAPARPASAAPVASAAMAPAAPAPRPVAAAAGGPGVIPSPLAGKVVSIDVQAGQAVTEGQQVLTLEAMKMNTFVYAPKAGTVVRVHVGAGDAVDEGAALITLG